ncbi:hypothetical protein DFH06DRAFT_156848 [Mycena polygramma]|nr:hypothetical protein DFH06DRAFT_156848 [Mycena polygramma]
MNFFAALLASFLAVAVANPVNNGVVRNSDSVLEARVVTRSCLTLPYLICEGGLDQEVACNGDGWTCPGNGLHPTTSNATCAAQCICEIPCPGA